MTTEAIIIIAILVWLIVGAVIHKLAERAGYTFGNYPGDGGLCRFMIVLQAPAVILHFLWSDTWWALVHGEEWEPMAVARMLWMIFKDPALSPDDAFNRMSKGDR